MAVVPDDKATKVNRFQLLVSSTHTMLCCPGSIPGCHVAKRGEAGWIADVTVYDPADYGLTEEDDDQVPDISVDPEDHTLTVINTSHEVADNGLSAAHALFRALSAQTHCFRSNVTTFHYFIP